MGHTGRLGLEGPLDAPRICCLDLDTFFVSVERVLNPELERAPVIVGGRPGARGVVTAASYEVRALGVKAGMPLTEAGRLAPDAIFLPTRGGVYGEYAERVREIARRFSPVVQIASIDEMFLDLSGCEALFRASPNLMLRTIPTHVSDDTCIEFAVRAMAATIKTELGLPASAGVATSRAVAKIASNLAKPKGVLLVPKGDEAHTLAPLPVRAYPGIGPVAEKKLHQRGLKTLEDVAGAPVGVLREIFGAGARGVVEGVRGNCSSNFGRERPNFNEIDRRGDVEGSLSNERTFATDVTEMDKVRGLCAR